MMTDARWDKVGALFEQVQSVPPEERDVVLEERFVREARAAAALGHSNIATIHEIGDMGNGRRFIAMAYYEGKTLKEKLNREESLPIEEAVGYAEQIGEALAGAHEAGIVHRDVKPSNVVIASPGETKLLDFGVAKAIKETRLTRSGQRLGTVSYMSPEQAEGGSVGPPADVWALGVVLYEMLAGTRPFVGKDEFAVLKAIRQEEPVPVQERRPSASAETQTTVMRCLRKDPDQRYASAGRLLKDIQAIRQKGPEA